jgi:hypothetical protein
LQLCTDTVSIGFPPLLEGRGRLNIVAGHFPQLMLIDLLDGIGLLCPTSGLDFSNTPQQHWSEWY